MSGSASFQRVRRFCPRITEQESRFVSQRGWPEFEALLEEANFDLFDFHRPEHHVASLFAASIANAGRGVAEPSETTGRNRVKTSERRGTASVPRDTLQVR